MTTRCLPVTDAAHPARSAAPFVGFCCLAVALSGALRAEDWTQFRGTSRDGAAPDQELPVEWNDQENVSWTADLPGRGPSSPIVVGNRVIVTASGGANQRRLHVLCFDARTGSRLWHRHFWATGRTLCHSDSAVAAPTPASSQGRVFAFFSSNDLACLDMDGNLLWYRGVAHDYPRAGNDVGMASSPLVVDGAVIVQVENQGDSFALGVDAATGENLWRIPRERRANWASPARLFDQANQRNLAVLQSPHGVTAVEPQNGEVVWQYEADCQSIPSPTAGGDIVYVPAGGITALRPDHHAEMKRPEVLWSENRLGPSGASPVIHDGRIYTVNRSGVLSCGDAHTGEVLWRLRLKGRFWASPVGVGKRLYLINTDGLAQVVQDTGTDGKLVGTGDFGETIQATPAVAQGALFVRSDARLWKVSSQP